MMHMQARLEKEISRFHKYVMPEPMSGCWLWMGSLDGRGYGSMRVGNTAVGRSIVRTHRFSYELYKGPIPDDMCLDHLCRVRSCCNPDHLEPVTIRENILRGEALSAQRAKQTHCKNGHEFTPANTRVSPKNERICRACARERERRLYAEDRQRDRVKAIPKCGERSGYESGCRCRPCKDSHNLRMREQRKRRSK